MIVTNMSSKVLIRQLLSSLCLPDFLILCLMISLSQQLGIRPVLLAGLVATYMKLAYILLLRGSSSSVGKSI